MKQYEPKFLPLIARLRETETTSTTRLALRVGEAAATLGVSEDLFHDRIAPELAWVRVGRVRMVAVTELQRWLDANAEQAIEGSPPDDR